MFISKKIEKFGEFFRKPFEEGQYNLVQKSTLDLQRQYFFGKKLNIEHAKHADALLKFDM